MGFVAAEKSLLEKANGEVFVALNLATLGLKSKVSVALIPSPNIGISFEYLYSSYDPTV